MIIQFVTLHFSIGFGGISSTNNETRSSLECLARSTALVTITRSREIVTRNHVIFMTNESTLFFSLPLFVGPQVLSSQSARIRCIENILCILYIVTKLNPCTPTTNLSSLPLLG